MKRTNAKLTGNRCKCTACGEVFSTERNFDKHRIGEYGVDRRCAQPDDVGLIIVNTNTGSVWKMEPPANSYWETIRK